MAVIAVARPAGAWRGQIVDREGRPVKGAEVFVLGRPGGTVTDDLGAFAWQPDPVPPFELLVVLPGGIPMQPLLVPRLEGPAVAVLTVSPSLSESVTVSGAAPGIAVSPAAGTSTTGADDIAARQPSSLTQVLENVAGVRRASEGQASVPAVRGLARGRTLILIDGARVSSERRIGPGAATLDPGMIDSVDVARGPGAVMYGSDAIGGVISVRTRRVAPGAPWLLRSSFTLGAGYPERRLSAEVSKGLPRGGLLVAAHIRGADDWRSSRGPVLNSGYSDRGFVARAQHELGPGVLTASWQGDFGRDLERPRDNSDVVRFYYPSDDAQRFTLGFEAEGLGAVDRLGVLAFWGRSTVITDQDRAATSSRPRSVERAEVRADDFQIRILAERILGRARLSGGVEVQGRAGLEALDVAIAYARDGRITTYDESVAVADATKVATGVFASIDAAIGGPLSIAGGLRGDWVRSSTAGGYFGARQAANGAVAGFVATTASAGGFQATLQVARGFREPTLSDRYFRGPSGRGFITGNPDLSPETSAQLDLALRYTRPGLRLAAFYYHYRIDDLIERFEDGSGDFFFRNRGRARLRGFELEGHASLGHGYSLEFASGLANGRALDDDSALDDVAPVTFSAQLRKLVGERGSIQLRASAVADDEHPGPSERRVSGHVLFEASGGYRPLAGVELRLILRNLLDRAYFASEDPRAVLAPGRSLSLVAALRL